jgi:hypothetical protein
MNKTVFSLALTAALSLTSIGSVAAQSDFSVGACGSIVGALGTGRAQFQVFGDLDEQGQPTGFVIYRDPDANFRLRALSNQIVSIVRDGCVTTMEGTANTPEGPVNWQIVMGDNGEPGRGRDTFSITTGAYNNTQVLIQGEIQADGVICPAP